MPRTHRIFCHCGMDVVVWEHKHFPDLYHLFIMVSHVTDLALDFNIFQSFVEGSVRRQLTGSNEARLKNLTYWCCCDLKNRHKVTEQANVISHSVVVIAVETAIASLQTRKQATVKFEVVCFPGNQL